MIQSFFREFRRQLLIIYAIIGGIVVIALVVAARPIHYQVRGGLRLRPLQREAVEKARRKINGGEKSRFRVLSAYAVPISRRNCPVRWDENQSSNERTDFLHSLASG